MHWNTYLNCYVMLLSHAAGEPGWAQEGVFVSFSSDLTRPESWTAPRKILDKSEFPGWYFFYPQVMGLESGGTDRRAGQVARLYVGGISKWEIEFIAPASAPVAVQIAASSGSRPVLAGKPVALSVAPMGAQPFTFQWFKDGVALPTATTASLEIAAATIGDAGVYHVVVSNPLGTITSPSFSLAVTPVTPPTTTRPAEVSAPTPPVAPPPPPAPPPPEAFLSNLSVRSVLGADSPRLSVGFVVRSAAPKPLLLRAVGPTLAGFGVVDAVMNPRLAAFNAASVQVASSSEWPASHADVFAAVGAFPLVAGSADASLLIEVPEGIGTAQVTAKTGGVVLAEIYDPLPSSASKLVNFSARALVGSGEQAMIGGFSVGGREANAC